MTLFVDGFPRRTEYWIVGVDPENELHASHTVVPPELVDAVTILAGLDVGEPLDKPCRLDPTRMARIARLLGIAPQPNMDYSFEKMDLPD